jgi:hypothetical protein
LFREKEPKHDVQVKTPTREREKNETGKGRLEGKQWRFLRIPLVQWRLLQQSLSDLGAVPTNSADPK